MIHTITNTLAGLLYLILFYCLGQWTQSATQLPVPGSILGMLYLFIYLSWRGQVSHRILSGSNLLIDYLSLILIPGCVGIMTCFQLMARDAWVILLTLAITLPFSFCLAAWLLGRLTGTLQPESITPEVGNR
ncbi:MAG: CidA/LrgA family protein [Pseudomonadales bacterium]|jgi:holin-like protein